ncbi:MAG: hypothetical protein K8T20_13855 [Planctomycetes bacterium]|nr:hypothetical protein [Planctomycetota bacterium]
MRADVLKSQGVQKVLGDRYVCTWKNIENDSICGSSYAHDPAEKPGICAPGEGEHNTQACVFTPDGYLLDVMAGYQTPEALVDEMKWVTEKLKAIGNNPNLSVEDRKVRVSKEHEGTLRHPKPNNAILDTKFMIRHAMDTFGDFKADDLVEGRGFGDHFFGRFGKDMPGEVLGKVPGYQQALVDEKRCDDIMEEARKLRVKYGAAEGRAKEEIVVRLRELETEYKTLRAKNAEIARQVEQAKK